MSAGRRNFLKNVGATALLPVLQAFSKETDTRPAYHRILSCNIRVALDDDETKGVGWSARRDICLKIIKDRKPDIISLQEVLKVYEDTHHHVNIELKSDVFAYEGMGKKVL